jgi:hypothetical protein
MALPDSIAFTGANEASLNTCTFEKFRVGTDSPLPLGKVASNQLIERWFHVKQPS